MCLVYKYIHIVVVMVQICVCMYVCNTENQFKFILLYKYTTRPLAPTVHTCDYCLYFLLLITEQDKEKNALLNAPGVNNI